MGSPSQLPSSSLPSGRASSLLGVLQALFQHLNVVGVEGVDVLLLDEFGRFAVELHRSTEVAVSCVKNPGQPSWLFFGLVCDDVSEELIIWLEFEHVHQILLGTVGL
jgi:hypothetical protein